MNSLAARPLHFPALRLVLDPDAWDLEDPSAPVRGLRNLLLLAAAVVAVLWQIV
ncbi:MAG TPA: hypothetical protein VKD90_28770 [Gemmataceae bacterium]|nr:hypothetical protein [Gemmataceae bacterium]